MTIKNAHKTLLAVLLSFIFLVCSVHAQTITGKVVEVADGDTITVLEETTQHKIRLYGIDTPERGQDFGNRSKQFTSGMVFGKQVQLVQKDMDRYGRVVGMVYVGNIFVNEEIIKAGMAWVFDYYCKDMSARVGSYLRNRHKEPVLACGASLILCLHGTIGEVT